MATDPTDPSSVRVELDDSANRVGDADPVLDASGTVPGGGGSAGRLLVILATLGAVVLVVVLLRPESGTSAVGEPVGVPEAPVVTTTTGGRFQPDSTSGPSSTATTTDPSEEFERVPLEGFFLDGVVKADQGWIAHRLGQSGSELVRSADGLVWEPLSSGPLSGEIIGFDLVGDQITVAVSPSAGVRSEVQIWSLDEQAEWQHAPEYGTFRGDGDVFSAQFSDEAVVLLRATQETVRAPSPLVVDLLDGVLAPDLAARTCTATRVGVDSDQGSGRTNDLVFFDCDGDVVATIPEAELVDVGALPIVRCFEELDESGIAGLTFEAVRLSPDEEPVTIPIGPARFPLSIEATTDGLVMILASPLTFLPSCSEVGEENELRPTLHRWSPAGGLEQIDTEFVVDRQGGQGLDPFSLVLSLTADGDSFVLLTPSAAYETTADLDEFDLLVENPLPDGRLLPNLEHGTFVALSPDQLAVFDEENAWREIDINLRFEGSFVLATDEYVVIMFQEGPPVELVKIPFDAAAG